MNLDERIEAMHVKAFIGSYTSTFTGVEGANQEPFDLKKVLTAETKQLLRDVLEYVKPGAEVITAGANAGQSLINRGRLEACQEMTTKAKKLGL